MPGLYGIAVPCDYEKGVVDADPEADEHPQDGGETGHREDVAEQPSERIAGTDGNKGGDEG